MFRVRFVRTFRAAVAAAAATVALAAAAQTPRVGVSVDVAREVVRTTADGRRDVVLEPVEVVHPGDVLVYTLRARNEGDGPAYRARIEDPIPEGTVLLPDSVELAGAETLASLDDGRSWVPFPAVRERTGEDGRTVREPVPADAYTHLRWTLGEPLAPGKAHAVRFKVRVM